MNVFTVDSSPVEMPRDGPATVCPGCHEASLGRVAGRDDAHWLCPACSRCWRTGPGHVRPVDPVTCTGCSTRSRGECIEVFRRTFPVFGQSPLG